MPESQLSNIDRRTGQQIAAAPEQSVLTTSAELGWRGITAELHRITASEQPEHVVQTHRLMVHLGGPTRFEFREGGRWNSQLLVPGALYVLAEGTTNQPRWHDTMEFLAVGLDPAFLAGSFGDALAHDRVDLRPVRGEPDPLATRIAGLIHRELAEPSFAGPLFGEAVALALARHLFKRYGAGIVEPRGALSGAQVARVVEYVHTNLGEKIDLETLAAQVSISPYHFARLFRAATGVSPHQFVLKLRIHRAQVLMRKEQSGNLADLAVAAGFFDQAHFSNAFRRLVGVSPSAFAAGSARNRARIYKP